MATLTKTADELGAEKPGLKARALLFFGGAPVDRADLERRLGANQVEVLWIESANQGLAELARRNAPVLIDLARGPIALQLAREIRTHRPAATLFAIADYARPELTTEAIVAGAADVFGRPLPAERLGRMLRDGWGEKSSAASREEVGGMDDLYCFSPAMRDLLPVITKAAATVGPMLIVGEEGCGRQAMARAIHGSDGQSRNGRFVAFDCAAAHQDAEALLFGASEDDEVARGPVRIGESGRLAEARGGTLYLRNLVEMPTRVQLRLIRVLRDREVVVGRSDVSVPLDVRVIVGAAAAIDTAVQDGYLHEDLYRRVTALRLHVPALRNRAEDIPALMNHAVRNACIAQGLAPKSMSRSALALAAALPWPGNVDEMKTLVEALIATTKNRILIEDMLLHVRLGGDTEMLAGAETLRRARARFERHYIAAVLRQHRGRITEAAKALGIQRPNLYRKLRALNVTRTGRRSGAA